MPLPEGFVLDNEESDLPSGAQAPRKVNLPKGFVLDKGLPPGFVLNRPAQKLGMTDRIASGINTVTGTLGRMAAPMLGTLWEGFKEDPGENVKEFGGVKALSPEPYGPSATTMYGREVPLPAPSKDVPLPVGLVPIGRGVKMFHEMADTPLGVATGGLARIPAAVPFLKSLGIVFGTKIAVEDLPQQIKETIKNPTPENLSDSTLQLMTLWAIKHGMGLDKEPPPTGAVPTENVSGAGALLPPTAGQEGRGVPGPRFSVAPGGDVVDLSQLSPAEQTELLRGPRAARNRPGTGVAVPPIVAPLQGPPLPIVPGRALTPKPEPPPGGQLQMNFDPEELRRLFEGVIPVAGQEKKEVQQSAQLPLPPGTKPYDPLFPTQKPVYDLTPPVEPPPGTPAEPTGQPPYRKVEPPTLPGQENLFTQKPTTLRPAVILDNGTKLIGEVGETHDDILERHGQDPSGRYNHYYPGRGYVLEDGTWVDRGRGAQIMGVEGTAKAGGLDSMDLPGAREKRDARVAREKAISKAQARVPQGQQPYPTGLASEGIKPGSVFRWEKDPVTPGLGNLFVGNEKVNPQPITYENAQRIVGASKGTFGPERTQNAIRELRTGSIPETQPPGGLQTVGEEIRQGTETQGATQEATQVHPLVKLLTPKWATQGLADKLYHAFINAGQRVRVPSEIWDELTTKQKDELVKRYRWRTGVDSKGKQWIQTPKVADMPSPQPSLGGPSLRPPGPNVIEPTKDWFYRRDLNEIFWNVRPTQEMLRSAENYLRREGIDDPQHRIQPPGSSGGRVTMGLDPEELRRQLKGVIPAGRRPETENLIKHLGVSQTEAESLLAAKDLTEARDILGSALRRKGIDTKNLGAEDDPGATHHNEAVESAMDDSLNYMLEEAGWSPSDRSEVMSVAQRKEAGGFVKLADRMKEAWKKKEFPLYYDLRNAVVTDDAVKQTVSGHFVATGDKTRIPYSFLASMVKALDNPDRWVRVDKEDWASIPEAERFYFGRDTSPGWQKVDIQGDLFIKAGKGARFQTDFASRPEGSFGTQFGTGEDRPRRSDPLWLRQMYEPPEINQPPVDPLEDDDLQGGRLYGGIPFFDPELLGLSREEAERLKALYIKGLSKKDPEAAKARMETENGKQFIPANEREKAILQTTRANPLRTEGKIIPQPGQRRTGIQNAELALRNYYQRAKDIAKKTDKVLLASNAIFDFLDGSRGDYKGPLMMNIKKPIDSAYQDEVALKDYLLDPIKEAARDMTTYEAERMGVYMNTLMEGGTERMLESGITQETIDEIVKTITPQELKVIAETRKMYDKIGPQIQKVAKEVDGIDLKLIPNYISWPREWDKYQKEPDLLATPEAKKNMTPDDVIWPGFPPVVSTRTIPGSLIERMPKAFTPIKINLFQILDRYVRDASHYVASRRLLKGIAETVRKPEFARVYGNLGQQIVMDELNANARQGRYVRDPFLDGLRKTVAVGIIAFRIPSQLVHTANVPLAIARVGPEWWWRGVREVVRERAQGFLKENFGETFERGGGEPGLAEMEAGGIGRRTTKQTLRHWGFFLQRWLDKVNAQATVMAHYMSELEKKGLDPSDYANLPVDKEARDHAIVLAQRAVASPLYKDVPPVLLKGGSLARSYFQFQNTFLDQWSNIRHDMISAGIYPSLFDKRLTGEERVQAAKRAGEMFLAIAAMLIWESTIKYEYKKEVTEDFPLLVNKLRGKGEKAVGGTMKEDDTFLNELGRETLRRIPTIGQTASAVLYGESGIPSIDIAATPAREWWQYHTKKEQSSKEIAATRGVTALAELAGMPGASQLGDLTLSAQKAQLFKTHENKLKELTGERPEEMSLIRRVESEQELKAKRGPMERADEARAAGRAVENIQKRGEDVEKLLSSEDLRWASSRGLKFPGFDNKITVGGTKVYLTREEMKRFTGYVAEEYKKTLEAIKVDKFLPEFEAASNDQKKVTFNKAMNEATKAARVRFAEELMSGAQKVGKTGKKKRYNIFGGEED